jgi:hypothetical protein
MRRRELIAGLRSAAAVAKGLGLGIPYQIGCALTSRSTETARAPPAA